MRKKKHSTNKIRAMYIVALIFLYISVISAYVCRYFENKTGLSLFAKRPLISVLVTSYNYERYIKQTLDSILAQTYKNYEVVIIDDGSTDNSVAVINEYVKKYKNFHLYQHENGVNKGLPASVKLGVEKAKGQYISFLESDDYWTPGNLLEKVKMINKHPDAVIISNHVIPFGFENNSVEKDDYYVKTLNHKLKERNIIEERQDLYNHIPTFSSVTIKRDVLLKLDFNTPIPAFLDLYIFKQIFAKYPLYHIKESLTYWRRHPQSFNSVLNQPHNYQNSDIFLRQLDNLLEEQKNISF